jgi:rhomboid protease GluP
MWFWLVLAPGLISRWFHRCVLQQRYSVARRLAQIIRWLHPADGWRQQPALLDALALAQRGELPAALEILQRQQNIKSGIGMDLVAAIHSHRLTNQWEELSRLLAGSEQAARNPSFLHWWLRAKGETGDVPGLVEHYDRHQPQIGKIMPPASRDLCRLSLFAFCGRRAAVERLFAGSLAEAPASIREFWLATADLAAGNTEAAKHQLEQLLPAADLPLRLAIERRLASRSQPPPLLDERAEQVLAEATREHGQDESFGAPRSLFSRQARATQMLILVNGFMFAVEMSLGGGSNPETLYRLGALYPPAVQAGEWWRLIAAFFLHYGWLHLTMNMLALWVLGPFAEFALGARRFLFVYLLSGAGSMAAVLWFSASEQVTLGASGAIMGLVGATGALMLRGWRRENAPIARRRLAATASIVAMQTAFDWMVPQVSMTGHLSGAGIGFVAALALRDRLGAKPGRRK